MWTVRCTMHIKEHLLVQISRFISLGCRLFTCNLPFQIICHFCSSLPGRQRSACHSAHLTPCHDTSTQLRSAPTLLFWRAAALCFIMTFGPMFASDPTGDGPQLTLLSANVTSMRKNFPIVRELGASYSFLQETTLNSQGQSSMKKALHKSGFDVHFGPPCGYKLSGSQVQHTVWNAKAGGLAAIARQPLPCKCITSTLPVYTSGRCCLTWIPTGVGTRGFYVLNIYGFVGAGAKNPKALSLNEDFLSNVIDEIATLGDVPVIAVGDFQTCPAKSRALGQAVASNFLFDLGALFAASEWTYQQGNNTNMRTRIDLALCNNTFLPYVKSVSILRDTGLPGHCPLKIGVDFPEYIDHKMVYRTPFAFKDIAPATPQQVLVLDGKYWQQHVCSAIRESLRLGDVDSAFNLWSRQAERYCASLHVLQQGKLTRRHFGRGLTPKVVQTPVQAPPASPEYGAADSRLAAMIKLERRLSQLCSKVCSCPMHGSPAYEQLLNLCMNVKQTWTRLFPGCNACFAQQPSDFQEACNLKGVLSKRITNYQQSIRDHRLEQHKERLIKDWSEGHRKHTFAWVRDLEPFTTPCFKHQSQKHEFVTKHAELHDMMLKEWSPLFNRYVQRSPPQYAGFLESFPNALPPQRQHTAQCPFTLPSLDSATIAATIKSLKTTAPGADGWNVRELQSLSTIAIELLTDIYNAIELHGKWPLSLQEVPVATLRKGEGNSPLDIRPISLTPILYRVWARTRFLQLQPWHMQWLPEQLRGGAPGRDSVDAFYELALEAELCAHTKRPLFGVLFDYTKCFDLVAWPVEQGLLTDLGMPLHVLKPMYSYAANIQRRFKLGSSVGPKFGNTNSISQGCPLAILRINALIAAWVHSITSHADLTQCSVGGYVDGRNMRSTDLQAIACRDPSLTKI